MKKGLLVSILITVILTSFIGIAVAYKQKYVSIEPHMGYGNGEYFYAGGKIYNYDGESGTRNPYYRQPTLSIEFNNEIIEFKPDSEGYFWIKMPVKETSQLNYGRNHLNEASVKILQKQKKRKNRNLVLVTDYGLNTEQIQVPFIEPFSKAQFILISDFDNTITKVKGLGLLEFISTNPKIFTLRKGMPELYNKICGDHNPVFYVTARPLGTYRVVQTILEENKLPLGPVLARDLGFWFINKGYSITDHKINAITSIIETYPDMKIIFIGDDKRNDASIYKKINEKYGDKILQTFIFNTKRRLKTDTETIDYVKTPQEIQQKLEKMDLL